MSDLQNISSTSASAAPKIGFVSLGCPNASVSIPRTAE
ncbi:hypothetical protein X805_30670 [Sphaerotilus natans subsp. natans DSM 6575]|uniref:Uncharacterized protein n=1 Tax=Sphaerotilus natans subsp. natans DSM 6575 TaxID=1286631 RepID=A0A059KIS1_9BURK|nr:hypothetical protein X805_30670 [Sphaerotilus natans subsp. natans DSM 6575]